MIVYPAIDIKDGKCVRLLKGDMNTETVFNNSVADQARIFQDMGFKWIHVVDLNGAVEGHSVNQEAINDIIKAVDLPIQLGGGIRNMQTIDEWFEAGIARIVLGTAAIKNQELVQEACIKYPNKIAVGIDAREQVIAVEGWKEETNFSVYDIATKMESYGVATIIYTDIDRDGALQGVNIHNIAKLAKKLHIPLIASGGVASDDDLLQLQDLKEGVEGVIVGRAIYDNKIKVEKFI